MEKYYVLHCNYTGGTYEVGVGKEGLRNAFFDDFRDKYGYDKHGISYDEDKKMDLEVYEFDTKEEVIEFMSHNMGVTKWSSPEDLKQKQLQYAEELFNQNKVYL